MTTISVRVLDDRVEQIMARLNMGSKPPETISLSSITYEIKQIQVKLGISSQPTQTTSLSDLAERMEKIEDALKALELFENYERKAEQQMSLLERIMKHYKDLASWLGRMLGS